MANEILINSYIGPGYFSKQYINSMLKSSKGKEVLVKISSLGGDLDHAVDIHDQFAEHGNITVEFNGFNASSATIISLSAAKIKISRNSYYLIHKVASWVDEWGYMNDDDLEKLISDLSKEKDENKKITLNVAQMYVNRTGKPVKEILDLMKKETWLTAEEALAWGFVDEVYDPKVKVNYFEDTRMVAMISAAGFPVPERKSHKSNHMSKTEKNSQIDEKSLTAFISKMFGLTPKNKENKENSQENPVSQDDRIAELEAKIAKLEEQDPKKKENEEDPEKAQKIANLEAKLAKLQNTEVPKETTEDPKKENKTDVVDKDARIKELENQVASLSNSTVDDPEIVKDKDGKKSNKTTDYQNSISEAKEIMDYLNQD